VTGGMIGSTLSTGRPNARRLLPWVAPMLLGLAACGSVDVAGSAGPVPGVHPATSVASTSSAPAVSSAASAKPRSSGARPASGAETHGAAVERWVTQILEERYEEACLSSAPVLPAGQDAATLCKNPDVFKSAKSLREAWAKPGVKLPPAGKVAVTGVTAKGDKVTVPDTAITLDGRTLRDLELIGATGNTGSFSLTFSVQKHDGAWYVEGFNINA
jgi:hypothetical protein